jgi:hypothetical protein
VSGLTPNGREAEDLAALFERAAVALGGRAADFLGASRNTVNVLDDNARDRFAAISTQCRDDAHTMQRLARRVEGLLADAARLDWLTEQQASVEYVGDELAPALGIWLVRDWFGDVVASEHATPREAIDAARAAVTSLFDETDEEDGVCCPVDDPSCTSGDGECHDACEPDASRGGAR